MKARPPRLSKTILSDVMLPADANNHGTVFGGVLLRMIDKVAGVCAHRHAQRSCVTVAMERIEFKIPVQVGDFVMMEAQVNYAGRTSMEIGVEVHAENLDTGKRRHTNSCLVTMVAIGPNKKPCPVPELVPETSDEKRRYKEAQERRKGRLA
ncbi:MAG: acyl-CoA thioesterase [Elusimicrobia bacterium]|nr:acyl-CoA thioesterase [Elusimicrobiota bacterium]